MKRKLLLLVEGDPERAREIQACVPETLHCVWAKSARAACGILRRDTFSGIMLDFDLYRSALGDPQFTGESVAEAADCRNQDTFAATRTPNMHRATRSLLESADGSMATAATRRRKHLVEQEQKRILLNPTGLLMEGDYTSLRFCFALLCS